MQKTVSIIVPVFNEGGNIRALYENISQALSLYNYEILFVDDGSSDDSAQRIYELADLDTRIKVLEFSRNFGKERATSAGLFHATGDAAIIIDADLQHPPSLIPVFIEKWKSGAEIVVGIRERNQGEGLVKKLGSIFFYRIMAWISETKILPGETDFRLVDRKVIDEFNKCTEKSRITRGLIDWLGFKREYVKFQANARQSGKSAYGFFKLLRLAFASFVGLSLFPLRLAGYLGIVITFFSGLIGLFVFVEKYILKDPWQMHFSGPAILAMIILFLVGIILICLGLMALYIGMIHGEVQNRPMYVIRNKKNFKKQDE